MKTSGLFCIALAVTIVLPAAAANLADVARLAGGDGAGSPAPTSPLPFSIPLDTAAFWSSPPYSGSVWGVGLVDLSDDGYPEVVVVFEQGNCYVYKNNGGVIEETPSWISDDIGFHIWPAFGDIDNDGDLDMAVACYSFVGGLTKVYYNVGGGLERSPGWVASSGGGTICDWGDFDNDGDLDLAIADMFASPAVFRNDSGTLTSMPVWRGADYNIDYAAAWLDVDNDGDLDLAVSGINGSIPALRVYKNGDGTLETTASWRSQVTGGDYLGTYIVPFDVDRDGDVDAAVSTGFINAQPNVVFRNNGGTLEGSPSWISSESGNSGGSLFGDLNGDGLLDWAVNDGVHGSVYERFGDTLSPTATWHSQDEGGLGVDLGDVDRDAVAYREDTLVSDGHGLFYLSRVPVEKFDLVVVDGDTLALTDYCVNVKRGWVSVKDSVPTGVEVVLGYHHSTDLEFLLSDYPNDNAHLYRSNQVGVAEPGRAVAGRSLRAAPNPFRSRVVIGGVEQTAAVFDVAGRPVRVVAARGRDAEWDGRDEFGRMVPPGVYLVRSAGLSVRVVRAH